jgi:hypothetical protein
MIDPFTLGSIVLSYALHIGHIGYTIYQNGYTIYQNGYTIYQNAPAKKDKKEIVKKEENPNPISDDIKQIGVEIQHTIDLIQKSESENGASASRDVVWKIDEQ